MCTAIQLGRSYFGRTLDYHDTYGAVPYRSEGGFELLHAKNILKAPFVGMAVEHEGVPLLFDGMNGYGICAAALNYPGLAVYSEACGKGVELASYEVIPYVLCNCRSIKEVKQELSDVRVTDESISGSMPSSPLHWMVSDGRDSLVFECDRDGTHVYENSVGVLTNAPSFVEQLALTDKTPLWDYSSSARFGAALRIREALNKCADEVTLADALGAFSAVGVPRGVHPKGIFHYTRYISVYDTSSLTMYLRRYAEQADATVEIRLKGSRGI